MLTAETTKKQDNSQRLPHNIQSVNRDTRPQQRNSSYNNPPPRSRFRCLICGYDHRATDCQEFKNMPIERRWETVRRMRICVNCCNQTNHDAHSCYLPPQCRQYGCRGRHHTLLHRISIQDPTTPVRTENLNIHKEPELPEIYFQIIPVTIRHGDNELETFAFMDSGSSASLILRDLKEELQVEGSPRPFSLAWTNGSIQEEPGSQTVSILIKDQSGKFINLDGLRTVESMELPKQTVDGAALKRKYRHLKGIHLASYRDGLPKIIIGLPHAHLMCALRTKLGRAGGPTAMQTHLGWVLLGASSSKSKQERLFSLMENGKEEKTMADLMKGYFSTEEFGVKLVTNLPQSKEEERAKILMKETLNKTKNGYEIGLLWKRDEIRLPESFAQALRRLQCLERKMERDAILKKWYHEEIAAYCQKGYAQAIEGNNLLKDEHNPKLNYIPHFAVINYNKPKPKPRLVFDAAAKNNGISLNSQLLSGPDAVASLFGILIRFREGRVGISGDIKEMFHQVGIRQEDRCAQRFLYRSNPNDKPQIFEMKVMTFGATCSPACAQFVRNENAALFQTRRI
ncbi:uncharacterized protein LOC133393142 [Anopheles gambiae]|uniref:uncharacterized protein LOC133393142 n=1 Tax=Anopheles gambiae TaxID=7165 RepID=UPI002AC8B138|nr:uncharacterized protein LOC133393142 [Anopheles gambiae]